jgi:hypothetical protein
MAFREVEIMREVHFPGSDFSYFHNCYVAVGRAVLLVPLKVFRR